MQTLKEAIEKERPAMEIYERVHAEFEAGKTWEQIDHGLTGMPNSISYDYWHDYMMARFKNKVRELLLISEHEPKE